MKKLFGIALLALAFLTPDLAQAGCIIGGGVICNSSAVATTSWDSSTKGTNLTLSNGNLTITGTAASYATVRAFASASSGKKYWEMTLTTRVTAQASITAGGFGVSTASTSNFLGSNTVANASIGWAGDGKIYKNSFVLSTIQTYTSGDTLCFALDLDNGKIWFRTNGGNWNNSVTDNPATNTGGQTISGMAAGAIFPMAASGNGNGDVMTANFGASAYAQSVPSGFGNW